MAGTLAELRGAAVPVLYSEFDIARSRVFLVEMADDV